MPWAFASLGAVVLVAATVLVTRSNGSGSGAPTHVPASTGVDRAGSASEPTAPLEAPPAISVDSLPDVNARPVPSAPAAAAPRCNEVELVDSADTKLRAGDAAGALAVTREHEQRCSSGVLVQERERIAIEALAKLGRADAARARARSFEARYPSSPHLRRVRRVIDELPR